jgi:DNA-binding protein H-NS
MDTLIHTSEINPTGTSHVHATAGKVSAYVGQYKNRHVSVCCLNASNRAWGGMGRTFRTWDEALAAYKSAEMKAIIEAARDFLAGEVTFDHTPSNIVPFRAA